MGYQPGVSERDSEPRQVHSLPNPHSGRSARNLTHVPRLQKRNVTGLNSAVGVCPIDMTEPDAGCFTNERTTPVCSFAGPPAIA